MSERVAVWVAGGFVLSGVCAQLIASQWSGFHRWEYVALIALGTGVLLRQAIAAQRVRAAPIALALAGVSTIGIAGLISALLGPDSELLVRAPGAIVRLRDASATVVFPVVDAAGIARGNAQLGLVTHGRTESVGGRHIVGALALEPVPRAVAYIDARDSAGRHLTITQPTGASFLSPTLLFTQTVPINGVARPVDTFALPAVRRVVHTVYLGADRLSPGASGKSVVLFAVDSDAGAPVKGGIAMGPSGENVHVAGLRLRAVLGGYPALRTSAVPPPGLLFCGMLLTVLGCGWRIRAGSPLH